MPKIPERLIDCVFYLYKNRRDAENGEKYGGTGFLVGIPSEKIPDRYYTYGVTNWHVAVDGGFSVIRLNTLDGATDIFEFDPQDWEFFPEGDDIAVSPRLPFDSSLHKGIFILTSVFATDEAVLKFEIGVGDDVFMVGRFIDHDGGATNLPAVRFGNISVMPTAIEQPTGYKGKSYCIDLHSRTGYSGSPVFVYRTAAGNLDETARTGKIFGEIHFFLFLLGIHWGQFPEEWEIVLREKLTEVMRQNLITDGNYIRGVSGMTCVIPAQKILDLLDIPKYRNERIKEDEELERNIQKN